MTRRDCDTAASRSGAAGGHGTRPTSDQPLQLELAAVPESVRAAREAVSGVLRNHGHGDAVDTAVLLTSELVTNAVVHARSTVQLHAAVQSGVLRVEAHDRSPRQPVRRDATRDSVDHRGLVIVSALADRWGYTELAGGKYVWFELAV